MPMTITWSKVSAAKALWVASLARAGPMPVTNAATPHDPAVPVCVKTGSSAVAWRPKDFTMAFSSGFIGASTATRFSGFVTRPS